VKNQYNNRYKPNLIQPGLLLVVNSS